MFEELIEKRLVGAIGVQVVDDSQSITIPVAVPKEGKADIIGVAYPSEFTPNVAFNIEVAIKNVGETDTIFVRISDKDTGQSLAGATKVVSGGDTWTWLQPIKLSQTTAFHGLIEAGHSE